jgi:hypothetical protein
MILEENSEEVLVFSPIRLFRISLFVYSGFPYRYLWFVIPDFLIRYSGFLYRYYSGFLYSLYLRYDEIGGRKEVYERAFSI